MLLPKLKRMGASIFILYSPLPTNKEAIGTFALAKVATAKEALALKSEYSFSLQFLMSFSLGIYSLFFTLSYYRGF